MCSVSVCRSASSRPDFAILGYAPAPFTPSDSHHGPAAAPANGPDYQRMLEQLADRLHVSAQTPPTFLLATTDDSHVAPENSVVFYLALHHAHVPAELHVFQNGGHGVGLSIGDPALAEWPNLLIHWLRGLGLLAK